MHSGTWTTSHGVIHESLREKIRKHQEIIQEKRRQGENNHEASVAENAEANARRILEWDKLIQDASLQSLKGAALSRVNKLRKKFLEGTLSKTEQEWFDEIRSAVTRSRKSKNAKKPSPETQTYPKKPEVNSFSVTEYTADNEVERFIQNLINKQLALSELRGKPRERKRKRKDENEDGMY